MDNHVSNHWAFIDEITDYFTPKKLHTHSVAHNKFSDWSQEEMNALLVLETHTQKEDIRNQVRKHGSEELLLSSSENLKKERLASLPTEVNWVTAGKVAPI